MLHAACTAIGRWIEVEQILPLSVTQSLRNVVHGANPSAIPVNTAMISLQEDSQAAYILDTLLNSIGAAQSSCCCSLGISNTSATSGLS